MRANGSVSGVGAVGARAGGAEVACVTQVGPRCEREADRDAAPWRARRDRPGHEGRVGSSASGTRARKPSRCGMPTTLRVSNLVWPVVTNARHVASPETAGLVSTPSRSSSTSTVCAGGQKVSRLVPSTGSTKTVSGPAVHTAACRPLEQPSAANDAGSAASKLAETGSGARTIAEPTTAPGGAEGRADSRPGRLPSRRRRPCPARDRCPSRLSRRAPCRMRGRTARPEASPNGRPRQGRAPAPSGARATASLQGRGRAAACLDALSDAPPTLMA